MKQRVVTKKEIEQVLFEGGKIRWVHWNAKATLLALDKRTNQYVELGTIRFDTYLQLDLREVNMKEPLFDENGNVNDDASPFARLKRWDAWQGYDDYILRVPEENLIPCQKYYLKRIWR